MADINYSEIQDNEIEAIKAIYMDDFELIDSNVKPWKVSKRFKEFRIRLCPFQEDLKRFVEINLRAKMPSHYPKIPPEIFLESPRGILERQLEELRALVKRKVNAAVGAEMIFDIADLVLEYISSHHAGTEKSSFHEQMIKRQEQLNKEEEARAREERERLIMLEKEKERQEQITLSRALEEEMIKKEKRLEDERRKRKLLRSNLYLGSYPHLMGRDIEESLETLKRIRHPGLLKLLAFKVETVEKDSSWHLFVLSETRLKMPTLNCLLQLSGGIELSVFKRYFFELLKAVQTLHSSRLVYNCIRSDHIFVDPSDTPVEDCTKTVFDQATSSTKFLPRIYAKNSNLMEGGARIDVSWCPPEFSKEGVVSYKTDIWDLGVVFAEALLGFKALHNSMSVKDLVEVTTLGFPARDLLTSMLQQDPEERPTIQILLQHSFFKESRDLSCSSNLKLAVGSTGNSFRSQSPTEKHGSLRRSPTLAPKTASRYDNDFEELEFLGKGGFGEVVKSRNKLDGRVYAVKKVRLGAKETESSRKILREVAALSRLHHQSVVRYYTAWLEDASGAWDDEDGFASDGTFEEESTDYSHTHEADSGFLFMESSSRRRLVFPESSQAFCDVSSREPLGGSVESSGQEAAQRVLYIQMEYCDRSTLRDVIDEGVLVDDAWKFFRQVLAGLDHLHSQGMIHRDLKPSNIFLASNGDVKIGDFGLATSSLNGVEVYNSGKQSVDFAQGSLTSEIGTSLYISPEVLTKARYSQKVDMYSLGIIFFEMLYPFATGMERVVTLRDLRLPEIRFPSNFNRNKLAAQTQIITRLLSHDEKERPTAMELLRSQLLPSRMEDEFVLECIRTVSNPSAPQYSQLIDSLFQAEPDRHIDLMYGRKALLNRDKATLYYGVIRTLLTKVFRRHGAVERDAPMLAPKATNFSELQKPYHALDQQGRVVQLPYDLTLPFSRMVARTSMCPIKRFVFGKVFRQNSDEVEGAPLEVLEADFDIVTPAADIASEAEVLKVLDEAMVSFPSGLTADYCFQINHGRIASLILDTCKVPSAHRATVAIILSQLGLTKTLAQVRALLGRGQLPRATVEELLVFEVAGDLETSHARLRKLLKPHKQLIDQIFNELSALTSYLRRLGVHRKLLFNSFLMYNLHYYESGVLFRAARGGKRGDIFAVGGRYDALLIAQRSPLVAVRTTPHAVGASIALQKLILMLERYEAQRLVSRKPEDDHTWTPRRLDVLIASFGPGLLEERMDIAKDLWSHHIRCDFVREPGELPVDTCGARWVVLVKSSRREGVKVRNLLAKSECEVATVDLPNYLTCEIAEQARLDLQAGPRRRGDTFYKISEEEASSRADLAFVPPNQLVLEETGVGPFGVSILNVGANRINPKRKRLLMDRALAAVLRIAHNAFKPNTQVFVMEVPSEDLRKFQDCQLYDEESFKRVLATLTPFHRSQLQAARAALLTLPRDPPTAWLYSVRDDCAVNYQLIQLK
ncbi:eukaryotic translation initiation factor 2-alpha kinase [Massospora cicadina]|nr:eukaryotic translation initiation factor 2-alpha kinase [Massospora cicadina]